MLLPFFSACRRARFQFFVCRDLRTGTDWGDNEWVASDPDAGHWLEADYGVRCYDARWWRYAPAAGAVGVAYAIGMPYAFLHLVRRFKALGERGDDGGHVARARVRMRVRWMAGNIFSSSKKSNDETPSRTRRWDRGKRRMRRGEC